MDTRTKYEIRTWDADLQDFTKQNGVPCRVVGVAGLRKAMRSLQSMGYDRRGPSVLIVKK